MRGHDSPGSCARRRRRRRAGCARAPWPPPRGLARASPEGFSRLRRGRRGRDERVSPFHRVSQSIRPIKRRVDRIVRTIVPKQFGSRHRVRFPCVRLTVRQHRSVVSRYTPSTMGNAASSYTRRCDAGANTASKRISLCTAGASMDVTSAVLRPRRGSSRARALAIARARVRRRACTTCDERALNRRRRFPVRASQFRRRGRPDPDRYAHPPVGMRPRPAVYPGRRQLCIASRRVSIVGTRRARRFLEEQGWRGGRRRAAARAGTTPPSVPRFHRVPRGRRRRDRRPPRWMAKTSPPGWSPRATRRVPRHATEPDRGFDVEQLVRRGRGPPWRPRVGGSPHPGVVGATAAAVRMEAASARRGRGLVGVCGWGATRATAPSSGPCPARTTCGRYASTAAVRPGTRARPSSVPTKTETSVCRSISSARRQRQRQTMISLYGQNGSSSHVRRSGERDDNLCLKGGKIHSSFVRPEQVYARSSPVDIAHERASQAISLGYRGSSVRVTASEGSDIACTLGSRNPERPTSSSR